MYKLQLFLAIIALLALAACGGGGGGAGAGGFGGGASNALNYTPIYRTEASGSIPVDILALDNSLRNLGDSTGHGATGVMAMGTQFSPNVSMNGFRVRLSNDRQTLTLSISGQPDIVLTADGTPSQFTGSWGDFFNGPYVTLTHTNGHSGKMTFQNINIGPPYSGTFGGGVYGLETPIGQLPDTPADYTGTFEGTSQLQALAAGNQSLVSGTFDMTVDFDTGLVDGTTAGSISVLGASVNVTDSGATGLINGSTIGNGFTGSWTLNGSTYALDADFAGKTYGWEAEDIGGALVGTVTGGGDSLNLYGTFESN